MPTTPAPTLTVNVDGSQIWYLHGKEHREDGPAVLYADGTEIWCQHDRRHREDGPAITYPDGTQSWYRHGRRHREDGPAVVEADGSTEWWMDGVALDWDKATTDAWLALTPDERTFALIHLREVGPAGAWQDVDALMTTARDTITAAIRRLAAGVAGFTVWSAVPQR